MTTDNISFKGFNNIFCAFDVPISNHRNVTFFSMQLNDEDGAKDLTEYLKLRQLQGEIVNPLSGDVLTLTFMQDSTKRSNHIYLNNKEMYWGDELREIGEKYVPQKMTMERYKQQEALHMKAYTFLAGLTKRMSAKVFDIDNREKAKVLENMFNTLYAIVKDKNDAYHLTERACFKNVKFQDLAEGINKAIAATMSKFFR